MSTQSKNLLTPEEYLEIERKAEFKSEYVLNPKLIIEVLSSSTEAYDRGRKFDQYRSLDSLAAYLMIASDRIHADLFTKQANGDWLLTAADRPDDMLHIESVGSRLKLSDAYLQSGLLASPAPTAG